VTIQKNEANEDDDGRRVYPMGQTGVMVHINLREGGG